jgi:hypothetical protein
MHPSEPTAIPGESGTDTDSSAQCSPPSSDLHTGKEDFSGGEGDQKPTAKHLSVVGQTIEAPTPANRTCCLSTFGGGSHTVARLESGPINATAVAYRVGMLAAYTFDPSTTQ